jgi:cardiolipin synthase
MDVVDPLRQAGGRVAVFAPLGFGELTRFHRRNHRRAIVIDGIVGFTGGVGVADAWLGSGAEPGSWRDDLARVTGPLARSLQGDFAQPWFSVTGELLTGPDVYPPESAPSVVDEVEEAPVPHHVSVASAPSPNHHPLRTVWWLSFAGARERIWITTPYFVPSEELRAVLRDRARAGVDVRLVTAGEHIDIPWVRWAGQRRYEDLLEAGVRIYEYQPTLIHSKRLVVDGTWSIVGSANIDRRSERLNYENVLTVLDGRFAAEMEDAFREDLAHARPIDLTAWRERGFFVRLRERVAGLLEEQL